MECSECSRFFSRLVTIEGFRHRVPPQIKKCFFTQMDKQNLVSESSIKWPCPCIRLEFDDTSFVRELPKDTERDWEPRHPRENVYPPFCLSASLCQFICVLCSNSMHSLNETRVGRAKLHLLVVSFMKAKKTEDRHFYAPHKKSWNQLMGLKSMRNLVN